MEEEERFRRVREGEKAGRLGGEKAGRRKTKAVSGREGYISAGSIRVISDMKR
jgi:hypothetical protein